MSPASPHAPRTRPPVGVLAPALAAAALAAATALPGCSGRSSSSSSTSASVHAAASASGFDGAALPAGIEAPPFTLTDQHGRRVSLAGYRGQVTVLSFLYSGCGTCVLAAQQIRGALDTLASAVPVLIISADPAADTPAKVTRFLARVSLAGRVEYLSGPRDRLSGLMRSYRITPPVGDGKAFERAVSVLLVDRQGGERVVFGLEQLTPESLAHDIGKLQEG